MTLNAVYRNDDKALLISDCRLTITEHGNKRVFDPCLKFVAIDNKIGLFLAGNTKLWKVTLPFINAVVKEVSIDNILLDDGPFKHEIETAALHNINMGSSLAIGFIVDPDKGNKQFCIRIDSGNGCIISELINKKCKVIGTGRYVPKIEERVDNILSGDRLNWTSDLYRRGCLMRTEIKAALADSGSLSYFKLGISPCMTVGVLDGSYFRLSGEVIQGKTFNGNHNIAFDYEFGRDDEGKIIFVDKLINTTVDVKEINELSLDLEAYTFDPEQIEMPDLSVQFPKADSVFILHQWVVPQFMKVVRIFKRIDFVTPRRLCFCRYNYSASIDCAIEDEIKQYPDSRDNCFTLSKDDIETLERELNETNLFDHELLARYIRNYYFNCFNAKDES